MAGFHEVVVNESTIETIQQRKAADKSLWRISSTLFGHIQSDQVLEPLYHFKNTESAVKYPSIATGDFVSVVVELLLENLSLYYSS